MAETLEERSRRKFTAGVLDQFASTLGALAGSVLVASVVTPLVAAIVNPGGTRQAVLALIVVIGGLSGVSLLCVAVSIKGWVKRLDDDQLANAPSYGD